MDCFRMSVPIPGQHDLFRDDGWGLAVCGAYLFFLYWITLRDGKTVRTRLRLAPCSFVRNYSDAVRAQLISSRVIGSDAYVVVAGPANTYAHYVTTREEYSVQRYEGASTIFGPCKSLSLSDFVANSTSPWPFLFWFARTDQY